MGVLSRFKDIMASNINALLDKAEDPEKMVDQCIRNLNADIGKVKSETAAVMADEQRAKRELDENTAQINKMAEYAKKAVAQGNDDDARQFLAKKASLTTKQEALQQTYDAAKANSDKMRQMYEKLTKDLAAVEDRRDIIKSKMRIAKAQQDINKITSSTGDAMDSLSAFDRMEEKANKLLDQANAEAELNRSADGGIDSLMDKYDDSSSGGDSALEDELAALKAELNK